MNKIIHNNLYYYDLIETFIKENVLSTTGWENLATYVEYWINGRKERENFTDLLPLYTCTAAGGTLETAIPVSGYWLLSMLAARILDDIQDNEGRCRPWNQGGVEKSLPVALALIYAANISLSQLESSEAYQQIMSAFSNAALLASKSQANPPVDLTLESYFHNIILSSGAVFATTTWAGARVATSDEALLEKLKNFGYSIGVRDAIRSDCLDLLPRDGEPSDLSAGVFTLPVIYGASLTEHPYHETLMSLLKQDEPLTTEQEEDIRTILDDMGAIMWSLRLAHEYHEKAVTILNELPEDKIKGLENYVSSEV